MSFLKYFSQILGLFLFLSLGQIAPVHAAMVSSSEVIADSERDQLVNMLEREDVQHQLVEQGVDPAAALARVNQMTNQEVSQLNGQIASLPAGAGVSTVELLLIIIIILLLV